MALTSYPEIKDLNACEDEPIRHNPRIQSHGCLLVLDHELNVLQCSANAPKFFGHEVDYLLTNKITKFLNKNDRRELGIWLEKPVDHDSFLVQLTEQFVAIPHLTESGYILEIEQCGEYWDASRFQRKMLNAISELSSTENRTELLQKSTEVVQELLGFDRIMIYQFDQDWNGEVVAESCKGDMESWLGLKYPATDIPKIARDLYLSQKIRLISDVKDQYHQLKPLLSPSRETLTDLSKAHLRGSSPIHIEYLINMGVSASLSCAITSNGKLWGLIACHNHSPKFLNFQKRQSCILLSELISAQINLKSGNEFLENVERMTQVRSRLVTAMSEKWDIIHGLTKGHVKGTDLLPDSSFAILYDGKTSCIGPLGDRSLVKKIVVEIEGKIGSEQLFISQCISADLPNLEIDPKQVSGVLYARISNKKKECLIWLRPEQIQYVNWGGNPDKQTTKKTATDRLSPRKSFEKWKQKVQCTSLPWKDQEVSVVKSLIDDIRNLIVTKYSEIKRLNKQLVSLNEELESFSYSVSHDLRGPLRGIDGFAQILMEDYETVLDDYGKESLQVIIKSASKMNDLMDDILGYSGLGKATKIDDNYDLSKICEEVIRDNNLLGEYPETKFEIAEDMPKIYGDKSMIYQLMTNLMTNAFKYSSKSENSEVHVGYDNDGENDIYFVRDNGIGFKMDYAKKIFGVFTRLVKDEFKGTGVGLAIAQRVVLRHHGQIWAESEIGEGSTFKFYFQKRKDA